MAIITTGDDVEIPVTLKKNGLTFVISGDAVVKARLTNIDSVTPLTDEFDVDINAVGSDLSQSLIVVEMDKVLSGAITKVGDAILEIQVSDPKTKTWKTNILIDQGNIA